MQCADHEKGSKPERTQGLLSGMISQRDAQGQHEVVVKLTCSAEEIDNLKTKWRLGGQGINRKHKREREWEQPKIKSIYCQLFLGSITVDCLTSLLTEIVFGPMYVLSTRPKILLRDLFQLKLTRPIKRQVYRMIE